MNTTLESLSNGVPMVAIPVANDQPGVAARIAYTGVGEVVALKELSVPKLRSAIVKVLTQESYRKRAIEMQGAIVGAGGVKKAADIIEQAVRYYQQTRKKTRFLRLLMRPKLQNPDSTSAQQKNMLQSPTTHHPPSE